MSLLLRDWRQRYAHTGEGGGGVLTEIVVLSQKCKESIHSPGS